MSRHFSQTVNVDVEIDSDDLENAGYHHEDDCPYPQDGDMESVVKDNRQIMLDWHDLKHGLGRWDTCTYEPCKILTDSFKNIAEK